jgi:hypothetical protein
MRDGPSGTRTHSVAADLHRASAQLRLSQINELNFRDIARRNVARLGQSG